MVMEGHATVAFLIGALAALAPVTTALLVQWFTGRRELEARHYEEKRKLYQTVVDGLVVELAFWSAERDQSGQLKKAELKSRVSEFRSGIILLGSTAVVRAWSRFEALAESSESSATDILAEWDCVLSAAREDLGQRRRNLKAGELVGLYMPAHMRSFVVSEIKRKQKSAKKAS